MWDSTEIIDTVHGLYFRWPCGVKGQGHNPLTRNISKTVTNARLDRRKHLHVEPTGFRLAPSDLILHDLQRSKKAVVLFDVKYVMNGNSYDVGLNGDYRQWATSLFTGT